MELIIKKLGGENAAKIHKSAVNIYNDFVEGKNQVIVVSAMRSEDFNTTDKLILLGKELQKKEINRQKIEKIIDSIKKFHIDLLNQELLCSKEKILDRLEKLFEKFSKNINYFLNQKNKKIIPNKKNDYSIVLENNKNLSILSFGEIISSKIISSVIDSLNLEGICSKSVDLGNIISEKDTNGKSEKEIFDMLCFKISNIIEEKRIGGHISVLSGYIGSFTNGIEKTIGRGYSDATAAIAAIGMSLKGYDTIIEIQKSVKGLMTADPKILENPGDAHILKKVDYLTAREITGDNGAQAKLLHFQTLRSEVQDANIKIHLVDPFSKEEGTWIVNKSECNGNNRGINFIGGRKNVIFFSISSGKMFERSILSRLFDIVGKYFSVDIVTASETEISFTVDGNGIDEKNIKKMIDKIQKEFKLIDNSISEFIEYRKNMALVFCVGECMKNNIGLMAKATDVLGKHKINLEIVSQGRLQRAMVFGIEEKDLKKAINLLHNKFISCAVK